LKKRKTKQSRPTKKPLVLVIEEDKKNKRKPIELPRQKNKLVDF
jgi:hypothetical protein